MHYALLNGKWFMSYEVVVGDAGEKPKRYIMCGGVMPRTD